MRFIKRFFQRSHSIYDCCKVVCKLQYLLGCSGIVRKRNNDKFVMDCKSQSYTLLICLVVVSALLVSASLKFQDPYFVKMDTLIKMIVYLELGVSVFMYLTTVFTMVRKGKTHLELYRRLYELDRILMKEFRCNLKYEILMRKHVIVIAAAGCFYLMVIVLAVFRAGGAKEFLTNLAAGVAYTFVTGGPHLTGYAQMNIARILQIRFRVLQKLMEKRYDSTSLKDEERHVGCLQRLMELVQEYNNCVVLCNKVFSISMLSTLLHDFTLTTSELYLIFAGSATAEHGLLLYFVVLGLVIPIYKTIEAPIYSEKAMDEVDECFKIIRNLDLLYPSNLKLRHMVFTSLMWRQDNYKPLTCGKMILNKALIGSVYTEIFNYILILVQFRMTQDMNNQIEKQKDTIQDWIGVNQLYNKSESN